MNIFIPVVGQFTNIGDVLHRRVLLSWLRPCGRLHVYVGKAPHSFIEALNLAPEDICYTNIGSWLRRLALSPMGQSAWVFTPGEMRLGRKRLLAEFALLPFLFKVRIANGAVLRVGVATDGGASPGWGTWWRGLLKASSRIYWRTLRDERDFRLGEVAPDLAFYDWDDGLSMRQDRNNLVISMRFDRPCPSENWYAAIHAIAEKHGMDVVVVSQVRMDNARTEVIARKLSAVAMPWRDEHSHLRQEELLRAIYQNAAMVLSDRLHVLIAAATCGAAPACILTAPSEKVGDHFEVLRLRQISLFDDSRSTSDLIAHLEMRLSEGADVQVACLGAKKRLDEIRCELVSILRGRANDRNSPPS